MNKKLLVSSLVILLSTSLCTLAFRSYKEIFEDPQIENVYPETNDPQTKENMKTFFINLFDDPCIYGCEIFGNDTTAKLNQKFYVDLKKMFDFILNNGTIDQNDIDQAFNSYKEFVETLIKTNDKTSEVLTFIAITFSRTMGIAHLESLLAKTGVRIMDPKKQTLFEQTLKIFEKKINSFLEEEFESFFKIANIKE